MGMFKTKTFKNFFKGSYVSFFSSGCRYLVRYVRRLFNTFLSFATVVKAFCKAKHICQANHQLHLTSKKRLHWTSSLPTFFIVVKCKSWMERPNSPKKLTQLITRKKRKEKLNGSLSISNITDSNGYQDQFYTKFMKLFTIDYSHSFYSVVNQLVW